MQPIDQQAFTRLLSDLVAIDSRSSESNLEVVEYIARRVSADPSVRTSRQPSTDGRKENLRLDKFPAAPSAAVQGLTLCGHLDVVPADEPNWKSPPFELTDTGTAWRGRGSADMKGFIALACMLFESTPAAALRAPLSLLFTFDEEVGSLGAKHLLDGDLLDGLPPRVLIGEPTELAVVHTHKGHLRLRVVSRGKPAHSGFPDRGFNAIEPLGRVIGALSELRETLRHEMLPSSSSFPEVPYTVINLATLSGGTAVNVIPERAELGLGVRLLPGCEVEALVDRMRDAVARVTGNDRVEVTLERLSPAMHLAEDDEFCRALCAAAGVQNPVSAAFSSDAGWLSRGGRSCLLYGPGSITTAHRADEYLPKKDVEKAAQVLSQLIAQYCCNRGAS